MTTGQDTVAKERVNSAVRLALKEFAPGVRLLACVSGGADSVAMLLALREAGATLEVAHCNFGLRGEESLRDENHVRELCRSLHLPLHLLRFNTRAYCAAQGVSIEMGCRELRYREFHRLRRELDCRRIAVAHNQDDNIETFFLNLLRGTGIDGLCGMEPDTGTILRPMLTLTRSEIEVYLRVCGTDYVTDSSNLSDDVKRNFLRLQVLPLLRTRWPGLDRTLPATIDNLRGSRRICSHAISEALEGEAPGSLCNDTIRQSPDARSLIRARFAPLGATPAQIREMAAAKHSGARWRLKDGYVVLDTHGFRFCPDAAVPDVASFATHTHTLTPALLQQIFSSPKGNREVWLPGTPDLYEWTTPASGMRMEPMGMAGSRKVTDMLRDARIPSPARPSYPLLRHRESGRIIWIPAVRRSRYYTVISSDRTVTHIITKL